MPFIYPLPRLPRALPMFYRGSCGTYVYNIQFDAPPTSPDTPKYYALAQYTFVRIRPNPLFISLTSSVCPFLPFLLPYLLVFK